MKNTKYLIRSRSFGCNKHCSRNFGKLNIYINSKGGFSLETLNLFSYGELKEMIRYLKKFLSLNPNEKLKVNQRKISLDELYNKFKIKVKAYVAFEFIEEKSQKSTKEIKLLYWVTDNFHFKIDFLNRSFSRKDLFKVVEELEKIEHKWLSKKDKKNDFKLITVSELPKKFKELEKGSSLIVA